MALTVVSALTAFAVLMGVQAIVGSFGRHRPARTTSDFYVASRAVSPLQNASAISSEYISAAAFLGTTGMVLAYGVDMLWLSIGAAAGYVVLLAFVTAPLRRSGAYTLSDFAEWRLGSTAVRRIVSTCVVFIGWLYLLPQLQGAGVTLGVVTGLPAWAGWSFVVVGVLVVVLSGGMRSITVVQAFQFWLKLAAVLVPALVFIAVWRTHGSPDPTLPRPTEFLARTTVSIDVDSAIRVPVATTVVVTGRLDGTRHGGDEVRLAEGEHVVGKGSRLTFPAGVAVPHATRIPVESGDSWATPFTGSRDHPLFATYSLLLSMLLGTMGLPHVVVRLYTNPCGRTARRTVGIVLVLLAMFYLFPALLGALGRLYTPELLLTGETDATVLLLPRRLTHGVLASMLTGLVTAGAFAAFMSTSCGVAVAIAGTISQRLLRGGVSGFRLGAVIAVGVPLGVVAWVGPLGSAALVTLAFAVSASSLCPLLVLGVWWRRLTPVGAGSGLVVGGALAGAAGLLQIFGGPRSGWFGTLLAQPAIAVVPVTFTLMVVVSLLTPGRVPRLAGRAMARLHLPEAVLSRQAPVTSGDIPVHLGGQVPEAVRTTHHDGPVGLSLDRSQ